MNIIKKSLSQNSAQLVIKKICHFELRSKLDPETSSG